jgi:hypothetical protein
MESHGAFMAAYAQLLEISINKAICRVEGDRNGLLRVVTDKGHAFSTINMSTCLNRCGGWPS